MFHQNNFIFPLRDNSCLVTQVYANVLLVLSHMYWCKWSNSCIVQYNY